MLIVFIKSVVTFLLVLVVVRLMGKRQIGEMQPFELVITFIIAEVACIPMNDPYIPFYYGIIPILTLAILHTVLTFLARKSLIARRIISGRSIIVIDKNGVNYSNLMRMNINLNDLIEAVRSSGYTDFNNIEYAIFETNGKVCVIPKENPDTVPYLPISLVLDGKLDHDNLALCGVDELQLMHALEKKGITKLNQLSYVDIRQSGLVYASPKNQKYFTFNMNIPGGNNW